jgi:hypothetical protein
MKSFEMKKHAQATRKTPSIINIIKIIQAFQISMGRVYS